MSSCTNAILNLLCEISYDSFSQTSLTHEDLRLIFKTLIKEGRIRCFIVTNNEGDDEIQRALTSLHQQYAKSRNEECVLLDFYLNKDLESVRSESRRNLGGHNQCPSNKERAKQCRQFYGKLSANCFRKSHKTRKKQRRQSWPNLQKQDKEARIMAEEQTNFSARGPDPRMALQQKIAEARGKMKEKLLPNKEKQQETSQKADEGRAQVRKRPGFLERLLPARGVHVQKSNLLQREHQRTMVTSVRDAQLERERKEELRRQREEAERQAALAEVDRAEKTAVGFEMPKVDHYPMPVPKGVIPSVYPNILWNLPTPHCYHSLSEIQHVLLNNIFSAEAIREQRRDRKKRSAGNSGRGTILELQDAISAQHGNTRQKTELELELAMSMQELESKLRRDSNFNDILLQDINLHQPHEVDGGPDPPPPDCKCPTVTRKIRPGMYRHRERIHDQCRGPTRARPCPCNPVSGMMTGPNLGERVDMLEDAIQDTDDWCANINQNWTGLRSEENNIDCLEHLLFTEAV